MTLKVCLPRPIQNEWIKIYNSVAFDVCLIDIHPRVVGFFREGIGRHCSKMHSWKMWWCSQTRLVENWKCFILTARNKFPIMSVNICSETVKLKLINRSVPFLQFLAYSFLASLYPGTQQQFTVHYLQWRMSPFMHQCWGLHRRLAQCMSPQGWSNLINAALLSLMRHVWVYAALLSSRVN